MEDHPNRRKLYTLTPEDGRYVIRRPNGEVVFRVKQEYERDAHELLANLNRMVVLDGRGD